LAKNERRRVILQWQFQNLAQIRQEVKGQIKNFEGEGEMNELRKRLKENLCECCKLYDKNLPKIKCSQCKAIDLIVNDFEKRIEGKAVEVALVGRTKSGYLNIKENWKRIAAVPLKSLKEKKYKSCPVPRGQYCKKHGVVHRESEG